MRSATWRSFACTSRLHASASSAYLWGTSGRRDEHLHARRACMFRRRQAHRPRAQMAIRGDLRPSEAIRGHQSAYRRMAPERHCSMLVRPPLSLGWSRRERVLWSKRERSSWCSVYLMREAIRGHQISSRGQRRHIQSALITSNQPSSHPISPHHIQSAIIISNQRHSPFR